MPKMNKPFILIRLGAVLVLSLVLFSSHLAHPHPALAAADSPIYVDALAGDWQDWSWDTTRSFDNAQPIHSGSASIAITYTAAWGGLFLHNDTAVPTSGYTAIRFWVHGGSAGGQSIHFHLNNGGGDYYFTVQADTWQLVTVPLAALGNPTALNDLMWQDNSEGGQPTFYLDDISLVEETSNGIGTWTAITSPVTYPLRSVAMLSANDGWAVGYQGSDPNGTLQGSVFLRWNGNSWTESGSDSSGPALSSVATVSDSDGWAVGNNSSNRSAIWRWNGSAWNSAQAPSGDPLKSVAMVSANDGWAVGGGGNCIQSLRLSGTIMHWDGSAWSAISLTDRVLNSVAMVSANDGWAVGYYCYAYWNNGSPEWDSDSLILRWNGSSWNEVGSPSFYSISSVAMASATEGWAVQGAGAAQHWNGSGWSWSSTPTDCDLMSVAMVSADDGWAVGGGGTACASQPSVILHWDGNAWSEIASPVSQKLNSVAMISANEGWAVGEAGVILHYKNRMDLTIIKAGDGSGTVTSNPAGIDCGDTACYASFDYNTPITLTATAATGSTFTGWSGSGCSGTGACTVSMNTASLVTANFTVSTTPTPTPEASIYLPIVMRSFGTPTPIPTPTSSPHLAYVGVNLAGADFGEDTLPGTYGINYIYPTAGEVDYFTGKGMTIFRLPFRWERLQQTQFAEFNADEQTRMDTFVNYATGKGAYVLLDPHNYARYYGNIIGESVVPVTAFMDFWSKLANHYRNNDHVIFGLMNEPNSMSTEVWVSDANAAIQAIRATGATNLILVPGNAWDGASSWGQDWYGTPNAVAMLSITDSGNNYAFEVHQYLDSDGSGTSETCVSDTIGSERMAYFTSWLRLNNKRAFLGEFGSSTNATCLAAIDNILTHLDQNSDVYLGWTYWAAGPWWGNYPFSVEPIDGVDRPQMTPLSSHFP
jgi:endoglucanase